MLHDRLEGVWGPKECASATLRWLPASFLVALGACTSADPTVDSPPPPASPESEAPVWSAEEAVRQLDAALAQGLPEPRQLASAYAGAVLQGDPTCPMLSTAGASVPGAGVWFAECESTSGWWYSGSALYEDTAGSTGRSLRITSSFDITDPTGGRFRGGGEVLYESETDGTGTVWEGQVGGEFGWSGQPGWLGVAASEALYLEGTESASASSLRLDGGVTYESVTVGFAGLYLDSATCETESPVASPGSVQVRDPGGRWFVLDLPGDCSGCGELFDGDTALGPACVSLAGVLEAVGSEP